MGEYGAPATVAPEVRIQPAYLAPAEAPRDSYLAASNEPVVESARDSYIVDPEPVVEAKNTYIAASPSLNSETYVPRTAANVRATARPKPIAILRSHHNPPAETAEFDYAFETENGIKQEATGSVRNVDDVDVSVMKGSYEFTGADGVVYTVEWYADETGFHASAPHLPKSVEPNHPEVAAAV